MYFLINELSLKGQFSDKYDADSHMSIIKEILQKIKYLTDLKIVTHQSISECEFYKGYTFLRWLQEYSSNPKKDADFLRLLISVIRGNCISKMLDGEFQNGLSSWECYFNDIDHCHSSLAGAAYFKGMLISVQKSEIFDVPLVTVHFKRNDEDLEEICIQNIYEIEHATRLRPKFVYHSKHDFLGYWKEATPMDLSNSEAQRALDQSVPYEGHTQRFSLYNGKFYEFKSDNFGGYHGYPVDENTVPNDIRKQLIEMLSDK